MSVSADTSEMLKKVLLRFTLLTAPALWLTGFIVYRAREYLASAHGLILHPLLYVFIMVVALSLVLQLTAGDILRDLRARKPVTK